MRHQIVSLDGRSVLLVTAILLVSLTATDAHSQWTTTSIPTSQSICKAQVATPQVAYALGCHSGTPQHLIRTKDGGLTWTKYDIPNVGDIQLMHWLDATTGFVGGQNGVLLRTSDGGQTWQQTQAVATNRWILSMNSLSDGSAALIGGGGGIFLRAVDFQADWKSWQSVLSSMSRPIYDIHLWSADRWLFAGDQAAVYRTEDNGATFRKATLAGATYMDTVSRVAFADSLRGVAVGTGGLRCHTSDAGASWTCAKDTNTADAWSLTWAGGSTFLGTTAGRVIQSDDYGVTWQDVHVGSSADDVVAAGHGTVFVFDGPGSEVHSRSAFVTNAEEPSVPLIDRLDAVYPNPSTETANIAVSLSMSGYARLSVYDLLGRIVLTSGSHTQAGRETFTVDVSSLPTGTYLVRLEQGSFIESTPFQVVR